MKIVEYVLICKGFDGKITDKVFFFPHKYVSVLLSTISTGTNKQLCTQLAPSNDTQLHQNVLPRPVHVPETTASFTNTILLNLWEFHEKKI